MAEDKSLCITYLLWLCLGWFGAHHFYLRRDKQAFVWWSTCGGYFWIGWIRDFWRIPEYVEDANEENEYMEYLNRRIKLRKEPPFNTSRFCGEVFIGHYYGILVRFAFPEEVPLSIYGPIVCLGITVGVYLVGNIGREKGQYMMPLLASLVTYVCLTFITGEEASYMYCSLAASCTFNYYREYRKTTVKKPISNRISHLSFGAMIIFALWTGFFTYNATITYQDGEKIKLTESLDHFFKSPAWLDFKTTFFDLYKEGKSKKWKNFYGDMVQAFDPTGEKNARKVLGTDTSSSEEEIRKAYKILVVKWHPDRYKGDHKDYAQHKFIEIQQAYELLQKRKKKNHFRKQRTEF